MLLGDSLYQGLILAEGYVYIEGIRCIDGILFYRGFRFVGSHYIRGCILPLRQTSSSFHNRVSLIFLNRRVEHPFTARVIPCRVLAKPSEASYRCSSGFNERIV